MDVEKLKSIHKVSVVWVEEATECDLADIRQLDIRMRGKSSWYKQMMISFNPISVTHWLKKEFFDTDNPDVITYHSTYRDNKFLDAEQIKVLESFKKTDPYYYSVYCLGEWGVIGRTVFDPTIITTRMAELRDKPYHIGRIEKGKLVADSQGLIKVFKQPEYGKYYVIGIDVAEGLIDGDYDAAVVLDNTTLEQVATFHGHIDVDLYAEEVYKLGRYYNDALLLPECNFNPGLVINLEKMQYPKIYMRQMLDDITGKPMMKHGWKTTKINRMTILSNLIEYVRDYPQLINDLDILDEMLTFTRNDRGRMEATAGAHDDLVLAHALALEAAMCNQQSKNAFREKGINYNKLYKMPQDIIDDWENGSQKTRELMAQMLKLYA